MHRYTIYIYEYAVQYCDGIAGGKTLKLFYPFLIFTFISKSVKYGREMMVRKLMTEFIVCVVEVSLYTNFGRSVELNAFKSIGST